MGASDETVQALIPRLKYVRYSKIRVNVAAQVRTVPVTLYFLNCSSLPAGRWSRNSFKSPKRSGTD